MMTSLVAAGSLCDFRTSVSILVRSVGLREYMLLGSNRTLIDILNTQDRDWITEKFAGWQVSTLMPTTMNMLFYTHRQRYMPSL